MTLEEINATMDRDEKFLEIFGYEYHENCDICKAFWERHLEEEGQ